MTYGTLPPVAYPPLSKLLHWLVALAILIQVPIALIMTRIADGPLKDSLFVWHKGLGVLILFLVVIRIINRLMVGAPAAEPDIAPWQKTASSAVHGLLYVLLFALPLGGWIGMSAFGEGAPFFGLFTLPPLPIGKNEALSEQIFVVHRWLGYLLALVAAMHVAAALQHYFIHKDGVLQRMLPRALGGN
jgi:cytochrome b561